MDTSEVKTLLSAAGFAVKSEKRLGNDTGIQLRLTNGAIVNVFDKGTFSVQGTNSGEVEKALGAPPVASAPATSRPTRVFVVYGHDQTARTQLEAMLRRWGL